MATTSNAVPVSAGNSRTDGGTPSTRVPVRTILAVVGIVLGVVATVAFLGAVAGILAWIAVAAFLAVVFGPLVNVTQRRLHLRRSIAVLVVFVVATLLFAVAMVVFVRPVAKEAGDFVQKAPEYVRQARTGSGPIGGLVRRFKLDKYVADNQQVLRADLTQLSGPALSVLGAVSRTIVALLTIVVLTFMMLVEGPQLLAAGLNALPEKRRERVRRVCTDAARAVTGYVTGNLLISVIAGGFTYVMLWILGVPYKGAVALFVGFADLIPLVGATLGAIAAIGVAALHSLPAAIVMLVFFVVYQQAENHLLQPVIMARTVKLSALTVLVSVLIGVEFAGFLGALFAIPVAGIVKVVGRDVWDAHGRRAESGSPSGSGIEDTLDLAAHEQPSPGRSPSEVRG